MGLCMAQHSSTPRLLTAALCTSKDGYKDVTVLYCSLHGMALPRPAGRVHASSIGCQQSQIESFAWCSVCTGFTSQNHMFFASHPYLEHVLDPTVFVPGCKGGADPAKPGALFALFSSIQASYSKHFLEQVCVTLFVKMHSIARTLVLRGHASLLFCTRSLRWEQPRNIQHPASCCPYQA